MSDFSAMMLGSPDSIHPEQWTSQQVARWLTTLSPSSISKAYSSKFKENDIVGEVLIQLDPESLKDIGVASIGHRLSILKAVYDLKIRWGIEIGPDDWKPMQDGIASTSTTSASSSSSTNSTKTMADISALAMLRALQERDERVRALELELARLEDWLVRWTGEAASLSKVDPLQPYFPPSKSYSSLPEGMHPLDDFHHSAQTLGIVSDRIPTSAFSGPMTAINSAETINNNTTAHESLTFLGPTKTALATPSSATFHSLDDPTHYAPGNISQMEMSPTSSTATPSATPTSAHPPSSSLPSTFTSIDSSTASRMASPTSSTALSTTLQGNAAIAAAAAAASSSSNNASQRGILSGGNMQSNASSTEDKMDAKSGGNDTPYKSFRVTLDDPCHKVLPAALKKYKIDDDWRQYALFICYGTTERCLSYDEKPLLLFQKLKEAKQSPVFMLRHIRDVKSPIAIASAKAAARKSANGTASTESDKLKSSTSGSSISGGSKVKANESKIGSSKDSTSRSRNEAEDSFKDSPPGQPLLSGPAAHLDNSKASTSSTDSFAIAIYPYVSEREDELDVSVGDTYIVKSKAKGWWIVQRDAKASGQADVVGLVRNADGSAKNGGEIRSGWVPAGCLLETKQPLSNILPPSSSRSYSPKTPSEGTFSHQQQRAPSSPGGAVEDDANTPKPSSLSNLMAKAPIPPSLITSTSTPGILLMDFHSPEENIHLQKDARLRVFKRYNHWSYCVEEGSRHARAWLPSWYIGKVSSSRSGGAAVAASSTNGTLPSQRGNSSAGIGNSGRAEVLPLM